MDRVTYKPLGMSSSSIKNDDMLDLAEEVDCQDDDDEDDDDDVDNVLFSRLQSPFNDERSYNQQQHLNYIFTKFSSAHNQKFGLRQLRLLLYVIAIILFLLFIAQLLTNDRESTRISTRQTASVLGTTNSGQEQGKLSSSSSSSSSAAAKIETTMKGGALMSNNNIYLNSNGNNRRPQYETYLSSVLNERNSKNNNQLNESRGEPFDDLHFLSNEDQQQQQHYSSSRQSTIWWLLNMRDGDKYVTVTNYIRAMKSFNYNASVTLTTQATTEFIYHTLELCKRWDGPISVAVFSPGSEMLVVTTLIKFMRQCLPIPLSACIRDKVTWHLVYNRQHGSPPSAISYPKLHLDSANYPLFVNQDQCPKFKGPEPVDLIKQFEVDLRKKNGIFDRTYRQQFNLPYPINVLRNTARLAASTRYVLASDIELYPSINLVPSFINYLKNHDIREEHANVDRFDFTLPIFEIKANLSAPRTKQELIKLIQNGDAIFFHKWVCDECQNYPNRLDWLQTDRFGFENYQANENEISIFEITQRDKVKSFWEPIFIGTNDDPLYDDRLTWEGRRDKMAQMYEMCLLGYKHFVLGNAFLVHAPGIKHIDRNDTIKRLNYIRQNNAIYDKTIAKLRQQYSNSSYIAKC